MNRLKKIFLSAGLLLMTAGVSLFGLVACKDEKMVTFIFNTNGGTEISQIEKEVGTEYVLPIPEKEGYDFEGWYTNEAFEGEAVTSVIAEANVAYYAKWSKLYAITLELNGGSLSKTTLYVKEGVNVYDYMQAYVPTKNGLVFGAWFNGEVELSKNTVMKSADLTLSAKYKVEYTIEIYEQTFALDSYEKVAEDIKGYAYVDEAFTSEQKRAGFVEVKKEDTVDAVEKLSANASENVFRHYFNREKFTVSFNLNYPDGREAANVSTTVVYGEEVSIPSDYTLEGYCLVGWSTSASGDVLYKVDYIESVLYNGDGNGSTETADTFVPERDTVLYAVWNKGYVDMFGNNDYIYVLDAESKIAYLSRGNTFFKGKYDPKDRDFLFQNVNEKVLLRGRLNDNGTYVYYDEGRAEYSCTLYESGVGLGDAKIYFDAYNGIVFSAPDDDLGKVESNGTYQIDENGYYVATFTEGQLSGKTLTLVVGSVKVNNVDTPIFYVRNEEEYAMGALVRFVFNDSSLTYYTSAYQLILSGFGIAYYNAGTSYTNYYYTLDKENETITLKDMNTGADVDVVRLMEKSGVKGYMPYQSSFDQTYTLSSSATLTLDGVCNGVYKNGTTIVSGYYMTRTSVFGGTIVTLITAKKNYNFLITEVSTDITTEEVDENGNSLETTETITTYKIEEKAAKYSEYYYQNAEGEWYAPMLVLDDTAEGEAVLYGYTTSKKYQKVSIGTYTYDSVTNLYVYTANEYFETEDVSTRPVDIATIKSFIFALNSTTSYEFNYWYSSTTVEGEIVNYDAQYTSESGAKLTLIGKVAIYSENNSVFTGTYSTKDGLTTISTSTVSIYLELDEESKTFVTLTNAPYKAYVLKTDGSINRNEYIYFDGKGVATYVSTTKDDAGETVKTELVGTFESNKKTTAGGFEIYVFDSEDKSFEFIQLWMSSTVYVSIYNEEYNGIYYSDNNGYLELSGFSDWANYTDSTGEVYNSMYFFASETTIYMIVDEQYRYFDILEDGTFTVRGAEYAAYVLVDNQMANGLYLEFDGYGKLTVYKLEANADGVSERIEVDTNGTYTKDGDKVYTLVYTDGNKTVTLVGELGQITYSSNTINTFVISHKEVLQTYVNEDNWSILILDDVGNAVKYDSNGAKETGTYTLVTKNLLYYVNTARTDAGLYEYDVERATVTPITLKAKAYYTKDLESLLFSQYGYAIFNGTTQYYYNVENNNVTIYRQDATNTEANEYGFVAEDFGKFTDVKEYDEKTYYANSGFVLTFKRAEEGKAKYPVLVSEKIGKWPLEELYFTPSGEAEFTVSGLVSINGQNYNCYVTRELDENGKVEMYVTVANYRFDIQVEYNGESDDGINNNTYEIVRMRLMISAPSYYYLQMYYICYIYDSILGTDLLSTCTNDIGDIVIATEYGEDGEEERRYITGTFGEDSGMYDLNGNLMSFEEVGYEMNGSVYRVMLESEDGYTYYAYFVLQYNQMFGTYGYYFVFTRAQTITTSDGYTVQVERVVSSDNISLGSIYSLILKQSENELKADNILLVDGEVYYIVRTRDEDGKITQTTYYLIELVEDKADGSVGEEEDTTVTPYGSAFVTPEEITVVYTVDGKSFVDISETKGVTLLSIDGNLYVITSSEYDEATATYTVETASGNKYEIKVEDENIVISEAAEEDTESSEEA